MLNEPFFSVKIEANSCNYEILINDFKIVQEARGYPMNSELLFNEWISEPISIIKVTASPLPNQTIMDEEATVSIKIFSCEKSDKEQKRKTEVLSFTSPSFLANNQREPAKIYTETKSFETKLPFSTLLSNTNIFKIDNDTVETIVSTYRKIHQLFKNKDIDAIKKEIAIREQEYATVYYDSLDLRISNTLILIEKYFADNNLELWEFAPQHFLPKLYAFGKIITMADTKNFSPIFMINKKERKTINFPFYFARRSNQEELIILR